MICISGTGLSFRMIRRSPGCRTSSGIWGKSGVSSTERLARSYADTRPFHRGPAMLFVLYAVDAQFEDIPKEKLFSLFLDPDTIRLVFVPSIGMPKSNEDAQGQIRWWASQPNENIAKQLIYLQANRWYVDKDSDD